MNNRSDKTVFVFGVKVLRSYVQGLASVAKFEKQMINYLMKHNKDKKNKVHSVVAIAPNPMY